MQTTGHSQGVLERTWLRMLEQWRQAAGYNKTDWATQLNISPRTLRKWWEETGELPKRDKGSFRGILEGLYELRDKELGDSLRPAPDVILDWMALLGWRPGEVLALFDQKHRLYSWLEQGFTTSKDWGTIPALPSPCTARECSGSLAAALTGLADYRQPRYRVVVLYGLPGSGKTTLATAVVRSEAVQSYFHHGRWLNQSDYKTLREKPITSPEGTYPPWWQQMSREQTVGLVVLDEATDRQLIKEVLSHLGPQVRLLVITRDRPEVEIALTEQLRVDEVLYFSVGELTHSEAEAFIEAFSSKSISDTDRPYISQVIQRVGHPQPLRSLAAQALDVGWATVSKWVSTQKIDDIASESQWQEPFVKAWQRLSEPDRQRLSRLAHELPEESSFGMTLAKATWWQFSDPSVHYALKAFEQRGWLEQVDESDRETPSVLIEALGKPRYRLLPVCRHFIRQNSDQTGPPLVRVQGWLGRQWFIWWYFRRVIRPNKLEIVAGFIMTLGFVLRLPVKLLFFLSGRDYRSWDRDWVGGRLPKLLHAQWNDQARGLPAEIWLLNRELMVNGEYATVFFGLLFLWAAAMDPFEAQPWLRVGVVAALLVVVGVITKEVISWQLALYLLYRQTEPREIQLARRLLSWFK